MGNKSQEKNREPEAYESSYTLGSLFSRLHRQGIFPFRIFYLFSGPRNADKVVPPIEYKVLYKKDRISFPFIASMT